MPKGFSLVRESFVSELSGMARLWRHEATGAELLSVCNNDENKCFGVTFRTPPDDSTGVAHILEHSVLCGSERYPVKEPFVELLKGSLQTFLNAFTFPDKTCYPVASANLQDFYNLTNVYLDAVFFPRLTPAVLQQEGWHVEAEDADAPFSYKGVVYNEMKGVYSSPDSILSEESQHAVFPANTYSLDSGGKPEDILALTFRAFKDFHSACYTPSNARFFFWGDDPEEGRFDLLEPYLSRFEAGKPYASVPLQPRLETPRHIEVPFATAEDDLRGHITVNWLLCESADVEEMLLLEMLEHVLEGLPGSPLRRALIESGLGEDLAGTGLETDLRQAYFSVGLRSIDPARASDVEVLIMDTLAGLAEDGIPASAIEAACNSLEFALRENNTGSFPRGLSAMVRSLATWLYDGDPLAPLAWEAPLARLKARLDAGERVFENAIQRWFLDNTHRATVVLCPDAGLAARREEEERARLERVRNALTPAEREELVAETTALRETQETPDSPEALATIPGLTLADLPPRGTPIPSRESSAGSLATLCHELDTTGIVYASLLLPLSAVPLRLMPLVPLFGRALTEMGTRHHDYVELGTRIASKTGGLGAGPGFLTRREDGATLGHLYVGGKATVGKAPDFFHLIAEILLETRLDQQERFTHMVLEERARLEQGLVPAGHSVVAGRLRARHSLAARLSEMVSGVSYLGAVRALAERVNADWPGVLADLEELRSLILSRQGGLMNLTADAKTLGVVAPLVRELGEALPDREFHPADWEAEANTPLPENEALLVPAQVNYVGKGADLKAEGYVWKGSAAVVLRHLRMSWLWDQVRVQGGAYGAFCGLDRITGSFTQVSYRDPNVERTLEAYDGTADYLRRLKLSDRELELAIVGAVGDIDSYQLPDAKGATALRRHLVGDDDETLQRLREETLATTKADFTDFADFVGLAARIGSVCVLGGQAADQVAQERNWTRTKLL